MRPRRQARFALFACSFVTSEVPIPYCRINPRNPVRPATHADHAEIVRVVNLAYRVEDFFVRGDRASQFTQGQVLAALLFLCCHGLLHGQAPTRVVTH